MHRKNNLSKNKSEPVRAEDKNPIPIIVWIIFFVIVCWGVFYLLMYDSPTNKEVIFKEEYQNSLNRIKDKNSNEIIINDVKNANGEISFDKKNISNMETIFKKQFKFLKENKNNKDVILFTTITNNKEKVLATFYNTDIWKNNLEEFKKISQYNITYNGFNNKILSLNNNDWENLHKLLIKLFRITDL